MGNNKMIVEERSRDIGHFLVGRLLPFKEKRQVGPFTFIDHMGPSMVGPDQYMDVDQHPHIGLSTLTYLYEGQIEHRDSTGAIQVIEPGSVNLMIAGKGVSHTERTPPLLRNGLPHLVHGYQIWIALPTDLEETDPKFHHIRAEDLPHWEESGISFRLIIGEIMNRAAPTPATSPMYMMDLRNTTAESQAFSFDHHFYGEIAFVVVKGGIMANGERIEAGQMLIAKAIPECSIELSVGCMLLIFGGEPLPEPRYLHWNFVSSSKQRLEIAKEDWKNRKFPTVPNDDTYIPLP